MRTDLPCTVLVGYRASLGDTVRSGSNSLHGACSAAWLCWAAPSLLVSWARLRRTKDPFKRGREPSSRRVAKRNCLELSFQPSMGVSVRFSELRVLLPAAVLLSMSAFSASACCPSGDNGIHMAQSGLGEALPAATNLSSNPNWLVYGFERDGISYYQVNDLSGQVVLIVGNVDATFWTLPAGNSAAKVSLPSHRLRLPEKSVRRVVFQSARFSLVVYGEGASAVWAVESVDAAG